MSYQSERLARQSIVDVHRRLYDLGFSVANDGNTSIRVDKDRVLITPMGLNKAELKPEQIVAIDMKGNSLSSGTFLPSSERALHIAIYQVRADVTAIVHAHPPYAIACSLAKVSLAEPILPEVITALGAIPTARYATPSTQDFAEVAAELIKNHDAAILDRHGTVTVGAALSEAMQKLERLEHTAKIVAVAKAMGPVSALTQTEVDKLNQLAYAVGNKPSDSKINDALVDLITKEVKVALSQKS